MQFIVQICFLRFNPLDRGNLHQIQGFEPVISKVKDSLKFQSPRSGKFVSDDNMAKMAILRIGSVSIP